MTLSYPSPKLGPLLEVQPSPSLSCCPSIPTKQFRLSVSLICLYWTLYMSGIIQSTVLRVWHLSMRPLRLSHVVARIDSPRVSLLRPVRHTFFGLINKQNITILMQPLKRVQEQSEGPPKMATATVNLILTNAPCPFPPGLMKSHKRQLSLIWGPAHRWCWGKKKKDDFCFTPRPAFAKERLISNQDPREGWNHEGPGVYRITPR